MPFARDDSVAGENYPNPNVELFKDEDPKAQHLQLQETGWLGAEGKAHLVRLNAESEKKLLIGSFAGPESPSPWSQSTKLRAGPPIRWCGGSAGADRLRNEARRKPESTATQRRERGRIWRRKMRSLVRWLLMWCETWEENSAPTHQVLICDLRSISVK